MVLVFYLEGRSDREFLKNFLPRKFPKIKDNSVEVRYIIFEGKIGMNQYLKKKLQSYRDSRKSHFIILRDQDSENCIKVKEVLTQICQSAGKTNFSIPCRKENWYIGRKENSIEVRYLFFFLQQHNFIFALTLQPSFPKRT